MENHVTEEIFCLLLKQSQKRDKKLEVQFFLVQLLVLLALAGWPCFCLALEAFVGFTVGFAIGGAEFIGGEVAVDLSRWSWWKMLMSLRMCSIAKAGS